MELTSALFDHLTTAVPGSTSVNELRVLTAIGMATIDARHVGVTELAKQLEIPLSTTSRIVARLCEDGSVISVTHPDDDRRKSLQFSQSTLEGFAKWAQGCLDLRERMSPLLAS